MELYEQIRREYEHGSGTIREVSRKLGVHRREVRKALSSAIPAAGRYQSVIIRSLRQRFRSSTRSWRRTGRRPENSVTQRIGSGCGCSERCQKWMWQDRRYDGTYGCVRQRWAFWVMRYLCRSPID